MAKAEERCPDEVELTGCFVVTGHIAEGSDVSMTSDDVSATIREAQEAQTRQGCRPGPRWRGWRPQWGRARWRSPSTW